MNIATLPPTSGSVKQHSLRAYVLIQKCHGNKLDYTQWGWEMRANVLLPVGSERQVVYVHLCVAHVLERHVLM